MKSIFAALKKQLSVRLTRRQLLLIVLGAMITSFGLHNIHERTAITEGGVLGLMLFFEHWLGVSPAYITPVLDAACYLLALRFLGWEFIKISVISTLCVSGFFKVWEQFPPMLPDLSPYPLAAALAGALFVGVGVGLIIRQGGSAGGDDALALTISHVFKWRLSVCYMFTDFIVLALSLTYIPVLRIVYSLISVTLSSWLVDWVQNAGKKKETPPAAHS